MKNKTLAVALAIAAGLGTAGAAQAEGKIYVGAKLAYTDPDVPQFDSDFTLGMYGGYNLFGKDAQFAADLAGGTFAAEGELMMSTSKAKAGAAGKWDITSFGVYGAYRYPLSEAFYLKGRVGVVRYNLDTTLACDRSACGINYDLAAGIGGGMVLGPGRLEANITTYQSNVLNYDIGFHLSF
jgi:hypothetical protein